MLIYSTSYQIAEDKDAYYLPTFAASASRRVPLSSIGWSGRDLRLGTYRAGLPCSRVSDVDARPVLALLATCHSTSDAGLLHRPDYVDNILNAIEPEGCC